MKILTLDRLFRESVHISRISTAERYWHGKGECLCPFEQNGTEHTLCYAIDGRYEIRDAADSRVLFELAGGEAAFLPQGASGILCPAPDSNHAKGRVILVRFDMQDASGENITVEDAGFIWQDRDGSLFQLFYEANKSYMSFLSNSFALTGAVYAILSNMYDSAADNADKASELKHILPAIKVIEGAHAENVSISELASMCNLSESYFRTKFKEFSGGISPADYRNRLRVEKAKELLSSSLWTTDTVAQALGFYDTSHFYKIYKKVTGELPRACKIKDKR